MRQRRLHREEHAGEVGPDDLLEHLERRAAERRAAGDAGIGEHDVELAEFFDALLDRRFGRGDVGGVGHDRERVRPKLLRRRLQRLLLRPVMATFAPSATNSRAVASPMPLLPPVINAVLFASLTTASSGCIIKL